MPVYGYLTGLSPIGTLILAPKGELAIWTGLAVQAVLAGGATLLARRARRRLMDRAADAPATEYSSGLLRTAP